MGIAVRSAQSQRTDKGQREKNMQHDLSFKQAMSTMVPLLRPGYPMPGPIELSWGRTTRTSLPRTRASASVRTLPKQSFCVLPSSHRPNCLARAFLLPGPK